MIFEALSVYTATEDGEAQLAQRIVRQPRGLEAHTVREAESRLLRVSGLRLGDFALYASLADTDTVTETAYLVTDYHNEDTATIAAYELIKREPSEFVTRQLATSLQHLNPGELLDFDIDEDLMRYVDKRFPRKK